MSWNSQMSSEKRVKNDRLGSETIKTLYANYSNVQIDDAAFDQLCIDQIMNASGTKAKKVSFADKINHFQNRHKALKMTQDYILAGMGLGV